MTNIDDIISPSEKGNHNSYLPYADSQPKRVPVNNILLQRMPPLVNEEGINLEFQTFFDDLVKNVHEMFKDSTSFGLHMMSDQVLDVAEFHSIILAAWDKHLQEFRNTSIYARGVDIELNMERFEDIYRNLIGGFNIMTYILTVADDEFNSNKRITYFKKCCTELLFTYSQSDGFVVISRIQPFKELSE